MGYTGSRGSQNPDLVSGGAVTNGNQVKASGTTSSDAITFPSPTGGSGAGTTPSAVLAQTNGSGATLSGSGLGPYTVENLEDGDICQVTCTHTDNGDGQTTRDVAFVSVSPPVGGTVLDPDEYTNSLVSKNVSSSTTGSNLGSLSWRGPTDAGLAVLGGADAADYTLSDNGDGSADLLAATDLSEGDRTINVTIGAYSTGDITHTTLPDTSDLLMIATSDGYVYWRHGGGAWSVDEIWSGQNLATIGVIEDGGTIYAIVTRFDQTTAADTLQATDIVTPTWGGGTNIGSSGFAVQRAVCDGVSGWTMLSGNNGRVYAKLTADCITDGDFSGFSTCRMNSGSDWTGSGWSMVTRVVSQTGGRLVAVGHRGASQNPRVSTCDGAPTGTWTQRTFGSWTSGYCYGAAATDSLIVACGTSSTYGVLAFSEDGGETWDTTPAINGFTFRDVAVNNAGDLWVAVGHSGAIFTSPDPTVGIGNWTQRTSGTANDLYWVRWDDGAGEWITGGASATLLSSADAITWGAESFPAGTSGNFNAAETALTAAPA